MLSGQLQNTPLILVIHEGQYFFLLPMFPLCFCIWFRSSGLQSLPELQLYSARELDIHIQSFSVDFNSKPVARTLSMLKRVKFTSSSWSNMSLVSLDRICLCTCLLDWLIKVSSIIQFDFYIFFQDLPTVLNYLHVGFLILFRYIFFSCFQIL